MAYIPDDKLILRMITANIDGGMLNKDFALPEEETDEAFKSPEDFLPLTDEQKETIKGSIKLASGGRAVEAAEIIRGLAEKVPAAAAKEDLQAMIAEEQSELDMNNLVRLGLDLFTRSYKKEPVKYGLMITELFSANNMPSQLKDLIRVSAMCEELTPFAVPVMMRWNYSDLILKELATMVSEPASKIILDLISEEGSEN